MKFLFTFAQRRIELSVIPFSPAALNVSLSEFECSQLILSRFLEIQVHHVVVVHEHLIHRPPYSTDHQVRLCVLIDRSLSGIDLLQSVDVDPLVIVGLAPP